MVSVLHISALVLSLAIRARPSRSGARSTQPQRLDLTFLYWFSTHTDLVLGVLHGLMTLIWDSRLYFCEGNFPAANMFVVCQKRKTNARSNFPSTDHRMVHIPLFSHRTCPKGIDPFPSIVAVDEEQLIDCQCPGVCSGSLRLAFRGHSTRPIPFDSSAALVKYRLEVRTLSANFGCS